MKTIIYCLDCDDSFCDDLHQHGFEIIRGGLGYNRNGHKIINLKEPPNECDVMVFNLTNPACYSMHNWGRGNDNFKCTIVDKVNRSMYIDGSRSGTEKKHPVFNLIHRMQISKSNSIFDYSHLQKAISEGGTDCIFYLNPVFMFHALYDTPNWINIRFNTDITKVKKWSIGKDAIKICALLNEIDRGDLELDSPIEFKLLELEPPFKLKGIEVSRINLLINNVNECFAAIVKFGKGFIYFMPPFKKPVSATAKLINDILPVFKQSYAEFMQKHIMVSKSATQIKQETDEKIYGPGEQYSVYKDLKSIISGAEKEIFSSKNSPKRLEYLTSRIRS